jgi:hypothetical protein
MQTNFFFLLIHKYQTDVIFTFEPYRSIVYVTGSILKQIRNFAYCQKSLLSFLPQCSAFLSLSQSPSCLSALPCFFIASNAFIWTVQPEWHHGKQSANLSRYQHTSTMDVSRRLVSQSAIKAPPHVFSGSKQSEKALSRVSRVYSRNADSEHCP